MSPTDQAENATQHAPNETASEPGIPAELPDEVPEFVSEIHAQLNETLSEGFTGIGETISEIATNATVAEVVGLIGEVAGTIPV